MASAVTQPLLDTIEADDPTPTNAPSRGVNNNNANANGAKPREPVVLMSGNSATAMGSQDLESGISGIFRQSSHPVALFFLYVFRTAAIVVYILGGYLITDYVISTVVVVLLLSADFWNCRNVSGRTLVGLRFWNQVDEDGQSFWIFESRDPSRPANAIDSKMFWTALYVFPVLWVLLFILSILQLDLSFLPIVGLALVFNFTNVIGFTYADRDAKTKWANNIVSDNWSLGGFGGQIMGSVVKSSINRVLR